MTNLTLYNGLNAAFASDRFNVANGAMSLSTGYLQAPNGVYFDGGDYTVIAWVYPRQFTTNPRLIDFGNGAPSDNIAFCFSDDTKGNPFQAIFNGTTAQLVLVSTQPLQLNQWNHVAFTFSSSTMKACIYVNGVLTAVGTSPVLPNNVVRTQNYIGKANGLVANADAIFDEIKIFSIALTQFQVQAEMTNDYYGNFSASASGQNTFKSFLFN